MLLSQVTKSLVGSGLPDGVGVRLVGERELKDIDEPEIVYELTIPGVSVTGPPPVPSARSVPSGAPPSPPGRTPPLTAPPAPPAKGKRKRKDRSDDAGSRFDAQMEAWGARLEEAIQRRVGSSLDQAGPEAKNPGPLSDKDLAELKELENLGGMVAGFTKQLGTQLATLFAEIQTDEVPRASEDQEG